MTELKCPFCNKKLEPIGTSGQFQCGTWGCDASFNFIATKDVWEYIDHTKKKFDIAVDLLEIMNDGLPNGNRWKWEIEKALALINKKEEKCLI